MKITERRVVYQEWYESEYSTTGWDSHGWHFEDGTFDNTWEIVEHITTDKYGNAWVGIAEKETEIEL